MAGVARALYRFSSHISRRIVVDTVGITKTSREEGRHDQAVDLIKRRETIGVVRSLLVRVPTFSIALKCLLELCPAARVCLFSRVVVDGGILVSLFGRRRVGLEKKEKTFRVDSFRLF